MSSSDPDNPSKRVFFRKQWRGVARLPLQQFADALVQQVASGREFTCMVTTGEELADLNLRFRGKPESTDVLSFPADLPGDYLGDLAISLPHARLQAKEFGHSVQEEIQVLMLHGVLHLIGMDHETDGGAMRRAETRWRKKLQLPSGLIARTQ